MAITTLSPTAQSGTDDVLKQARAAGLRGQALTEIVDSWDMIQVWRTWLEGRHGNLVSLNHRSGGDDPPDVELNFAGSVVPFEHTWLLPYPLGWADHLKHEVFSDVCSNVPSLTKPPADRNELIAVMGSMEGQWSDVHDEWIALAKALIAAIRAKMKCLPHGGVIGVVNRAAFSDYDHQLLATLAWDFVNSDAGRDFGLYTLILHCRWNPLQFRSALIRRGEELLQRSIS